MIIQKLSTFKLDRKLVRIVETRNGFVRARIVQKELQLFGMTVDLIGNTAGCDGRRRA